MIDADDSVQQNVVEVVDSFHTVVVVDDTILKVVDEQTVEEVVE